MSVQRRSILVADDDPEDCLLIKDALEESECSCEIIFVSNGEELLRKLQGPMPAPDLILLDLNMPRKDGREVLRELKEDPELKQIPVVILTTSNLQEDVQECYSLGVNSYITKPASFRSLVDMMKCIHRYWFGLVKLPENLMTRCPFRFCAKFERTRNFP